MPDFPGSIFEPRVMENLPGLTRDPADAKNLFAEDYEVFHLRCTQVYPARLFL